MSVWRCGRERFLVLRAKDGRRDLAFLTCVHLSCPHLQREEIVHIVQLDHAPLPFWFLLSIWDSHLMRLLRLTVVTRWRLNFWWVILSLLTFTSHALLRRRSVNNRLLSPILVYYHLKLDLLLVLLLLGFRSTTSVVLFWEIIVAFDNQ